VTSDHGEEFREHGATLHRQLYDEVMHVPLVMRWPDVIPAGLRIETSVSLVDIVPTVLDLLRLPISSTDGVSLAPLLRDPSRGLERTVVFAEFPASAMTKYKTHQFVARRGDVKCILPAAGGAGRCFDLRDDPDERRALDGDANPATAEVHAMGEDYRRRSPGKIIEPAHRAPAEPDDRTEQKLRALGYVE
jgi:arylsulfatase A-like enzyme